jgi:hypothetical protein
MGTHSDTEMDTEKECAAALCRRARDIRLYSMELGELQFARGEVQRGGRAGVWLETVGGHRVRRIYALLLRGGHSETRLSRPRLASPTYCVFLDCAAVQAALGASAEGTPARLLEWTTDVLRRNAKLARRCWICGFRWCCASQCNYKECALCGARGHVRAACPGEPHPKEVNSFT